MKIKQKEAGIGPFFLKKTMYPSGHTVAYLGVYLEAHFLVKIPLSMRPLPSLIQYQQQPHTH